jgi:hypothetical protein
MVIASRSLLDPPLDDPLEPFWFGLLLPWSWFDPHAYAAIAATPITHATLSLCIAASSESSARDARDEASAVPERSEGQT